MIWALLSLALAVDAEGERVAEELLRYAMDSKWSAVEDQYVRLLRDHPTQVTGEIHRLGAQSARLEGNLLLSAQRLRRVPTDNPAFDDVSRDLNALEQTTGLVMLSVKKRNDFAPVAMPFAPEARVAIATATEHVRSDGYFVGLLPTGDYKVDGTTLKVIPGFHWQVLSTR